MLCSYGVKHTMCFSCLEIFLYFLGAGMYTHYCKVLIYCFCTQDEYIEVYIFILPSFSFHRLVSMGHQRK